MNHEEAFFVSLRQAIEATKPARHTFEPIPRHAPAHQYNPKSAKKQAPERKFNPACSRQI
ncbi:hypothetical protein DCC62_20785 [candidate division KSB1 bacterium]|nr:MAG: hypothetical protein DCC62_20785 [candidate division KSB1 bacterium]